MSVICNKIIEI